MESVVPNALCTLFALMKTCKLVLNVCLVFNSTTVAVVIRLRLHL